MTHEKIPPTSRQKGIFFVHFAIYVVGVIAMILVHAGQEKAAHGWVYPWQYWFIAAWSLAIIGHICSLWMSYEDPGMVNYERQTENG